MIKLTYVAFIMAIIFGMHFGMMAVAGSFFTIVWEKSYTAKPIHYYPVSKMTYEGSLLGMFHVVLETPKEMSCKVGMLDGPLTKIETEEYSGYHMLVKRVECLY